MPSREILNAIQNYESYIQRKGADEQAISAYMEACKFAFFNEKDIQYGMIISERIKQLINEVIRINTNGGDFKFIEEWSQENKKEVKLINWYYELLLYEAPYKIDSFKLYIERDRKRKDRFYEPRRKTLIKISDAIQRLENDELDILFLHQPPRTGKLLADDTPVFTSNGWKKHGDLVVGDKVIGSDGNFTEIIKVFPKDYADYKVTLTNGDTFYCHGNHEWTVCIHAYYETYETKDMIQKLKNGVTLELPQIANSWKLPSTHDYNKVAIKDIKPCNKRQGNCIQIANKNGLYAVGKSMQLTHNSGDITMDISWHCARDTEKSNLYVTYKEGLGGAFLDGVKEIYQDPTYRFSDVFPDVKIVDTDAKNNKLDLNRKKKYKTLSGKGLESGLNGEYDATGWLVVDDPLEGIQDVLSQEVLKRKKTIFDNNVLSRKKENCKLILEGTLWSPDDIYGSYLDFLQTTNTQLRYEIIKIPALDPVTEKSNFEYDYGVGFSTNYYLMVRSKHEINNDLASWDAQYQQDPTPRDGKIFDPQTMKFYKSLPEKKPVKIISHVDVALGGEDFLACPIAYYYENDDGTLQGYVVDVVYDNSEKHITQPQIIAKIKKHKIRNIHFESNQGGEGYKDDIKRKIKEDKTYKEPCNITSSWASSKKSKEQRIWDNAEDIRNLYYKEPIQQDKQYRMFMQNLYKFTMVHAKRFQDGAPDSLAGLIEFERNGSGVSVAKIFSSPF